MALNCDQITGRVFRPMFGRALDAGQLESLVLQSLAPAAADLQHRQQGDLFCLDWQKDGGRYTAGLQEAALLFVSMRFAPAQLSAGQVIACLGAPQWYQAWSDAYPGINSSSVQVVLVYPMQPVIVYCSRSFDFAPDRSPALDDRLPVTMINVFGTQWRDDERAIGQARPWPGNWQDLAVQPNVHQVPLNRDRGQAAVALPVAAVADVLDQIRRAFADAPRPQDDELLHAEARDDGDIQALLGVPHWRDLPDAAIEGEYTALAFLSPAGFRHFLPAYLSWVLRHPGGGAAVVGSTIFALTPAPAEPLRSFMLAKFSLLDADQAAAIVSFLRVMANYEDVAAALDFWYP